MTKRGPTREECLDRLSDVMLAAAIRIAVEDAEKEQLERAAGASGSGPNQSGRPSDGSDHERK